ncbi:hypothetical protein [Rhizobium sp. LjRoot258]|jgi:hypothetical protein|uniref:hypothetical protein n=1 Tax=Rhizobium sp. LjRoot258 TaxID=3342299 RepID=UPI003ECE5A98
MKPLKRYRPDMKESVERIGQRADPDRGEVGTVRPGKVPRQTSRLRSVRNQCPYGLKITFDAHVQRENCLEAGTRFVLEFLLRGIVPSQIDAVAFHGHQLRCEVSKRDRDADRIVDEERVEISVRELCRSSRSEAEIDSV